ncbi:MAG: 1-acyl-sn-glycerol-3-phosphate acyltransferase [Saprospiraceae bacterium]
MGKFIARLWLKLAGWKVNTTVPKEANHCVMIAAPHTTNWDFIYMRLAFYVLDIPMKVAIKDFWTKIFFFGWIIRSLGGIGINRSPKKPGEKRRSMVEAMADVIKKNDNIAMVIAIEGTRKAVKRWRMGFYHTALEANAPITFGYLDYEKKEAGVGGVVHPTGDINKDMKVILDFYKTIEPKFPDKFILDERYV